jgi:hypothetical protein
MRVPFAITFGFLSIGALGQVITAIAANGGVVDLINEPFSCDAITTLVRTLPDGTHITRQTMTVKMYRDSSGRTRSDRIPGKFFAGQPAPPETIMIRDPIAGYWYVLDTANKVARRNPYKSAQPGQNTIPLNELPIASAPVTNNSGPQIKIEDLGTQTMQGLIVQGRRTTATTPAGSIGNDRDIVNVSEIWSNKELRLMILQIHSDPRSGETTTKIENLSRTQPDPNLFQPPPDYMIVDATKSQ